MSDGAPSTSSDRVAAGVWSRTQQQQQQQQRNLSQLLQEFQIARIDLEKVDKKRAKLFSGSFTKFEWPETGVAFMGGVNSGKSTIANVIFGKSLYPSKHEAATARIDRHSTRLNSSHGKFNRMPTSARKQK